MSNPATLVEPFNGSLGAFTGVDPIRYDSGLWVERGKSNAIIDPLGVSASGWAPGANVSITPSAAMPGPLPGWLASRVTTCAKLTATADTSTGFLTFVTIPVLGVSAAPYIGQSYVWIPSTFNPTSMELIFSGFTGATQIQANVNVSLRDQWQLVAGTTVTPDAGDINGALNIRKSGGSGALLSGEFFYVAMLDAALGTYTTSPVAGSLGAGYAWTSTANASTSTRAASSASVPTAGHLDPSSGAIAFRVTPTIETGLEEIWGECGVKGSGTDHVQWGRDASTHPFVEWSANNAAYQRLTGTETLAAGTECLFYTDWDGTAIRLSIDNGTIQTDTRDAVSDSWGAGDLVLKAE